jgi:hypothetical protein
MQYLLLIYNPADGTGAPDPDAPMDPRWMQYTQDLHAAGVHRGGNALQATDTAATVRVRDTETLVSDGPYAETKEMLAGYYLIDVPDLDTALAWAAKIPSVDYGSIEVRPVMVFE